jgi:hypothetical protein
MQYLRRAGLSRSYTMDVSHCSAGANIPGVPASGLRKQRMHYIVTSLGRVLVIMLCCGFTLGCRRAASDVDSHSVPIYRLDAPFGHYSFATWTTEASLIVNYEASLNPAAWTYRLWGLDLTTLSLREIRFKLDDYGCDLLHLYNPQRLNYERFALVSVCYLNKGSTSVQSNLVISELVDGHYKLVDAYPLPSSSMRFSFSNDLTKAVLASDSGIADKLYWLGRDRASSVDIDFSTANWPDWSPDGTTIVFFGKRDLPGRPRIEWTFHPYTLYAMSADCESHRDTCKKSLQPLVPGISDPSAARWSPDGRWIVFDGQPSDQEKGVWLLERATGRLVRVAVGDYMRPSWSPRGDQLIVIGPPEGAKDLAALGRGSALYVIDVSSVVGSTATTR